MANYKSAWMSIEDAAKVLNCSPKDIEMLINVTMVADIRNSGEKLVNPKEIRSFLGKAQVIADKLSNSLKVEPKTKEEYEYIGGKEAAEKLGIPYDIFIKRCEDKTIPGEKRGRGWRIEKNKLDELIKAKEDPIFITRFFDPNFVNPPLDSSSGHGGIIKNPASSEEPEKNNDPPPPIIEEEEDGESAEDRALDSPGGAAPVKHPITIRGRKFNKGFSCCITDVALALKRSESFIKEEWIKKKKIIATEAPAPGSNGITYYIHQESLRNFLAIYNIEITFDNH